MDVLAFVGETLRNALGSRSPTLSTVARMGFGAPGDSYLANTRAYTGNVIVASAINQIARSAAEPRIIGKRLRRERNQVTDQVANWRALGISNRAGNRAIDRLLITNKYVEGVPNHPLIKMLNNPNPASSRGQLFSTLVMDRFIAGDAYLLKARNKLLGNVQELWRLRPDRVTIIPNRENNAVEAYEYKVGSETTRYPASDVIHLKHGQHPLDDWHGLSPIAAITGWISIDNFQQAFLHKFYTSGGTGPGSILTFKNKLPDEAKTAIREKMRSLFGGNSGFHETLIIDNSDTTYTQMGLDRGLRDALPKEISAETTSRIAMAFEVPASILGLLIGLESSSYANKRQDWQVLWDIVMTPLLSDIDDSLNTQLLPEFSGIDEVEFDLSDIRALQEDEEAIQERGRKNFMAGIWSWEETRAVTGVDPAPTEGTFFIPSNVVATPVERVGEEPEPPPPPVVSVPEEEALVAAFRSSVALLEAPRRGRRPLSEDAAARALYEQGEALRAKHPGMTIEQAAGRVGVSVSTYKRYRATFSQ